MSFFEEKLNRKKNSIDKGYFFNLEKTIFALDFFPNGSTKSIHCNYLEERNLKTNPVYLTKKMVIIFNKTNKINLFPNSEKQIIFVFKFEKFSIQ